MRHGMMKLMARGSGCVLALALTAVTLAQTSGNKPTTLTPPTPPSLGNSGGPILPILLAAVVAIVVIGVNFIPSKRGHQD